MRHIHLPYQKQTSLAKPLLIVTIAFSSLAMLAHADEMLENEVSHDTEKTIDLDSVVVVGSSIQSLMNTGDSDRYTTALTNSTIGIPQDLKDTTQTVSLITSQRLKDQPDLHRVIDVVNNATGLNMNQNDTDRFNIVSRGMNVDSISYDGVTNYYDTRFNYGDNHMDTAMYDRVEVVRGATGFMTGPGNPSASINLVRKRPTDQFKGYVAAETGSWNLYRLEADVSGKLNRDGTIRGRAVGVVQSRDSFMDRYEEKRQTLYGIVEFDITENTLLSIGGDYQKNNPKGAMAGGLPIFYSNGELTHYSHSANTAPKWASATTKSLNLYSTLEHEFENGWRTEANLTYSRNTLNFKNTYVAGNPNIDTNEGMITNYINNIRGKRTQKTFDWKLNGSFEAFGRYHFLRLNYNYNQNSYDNAYYNPIAGTLPPYLGDFTQPNFSFPEPEYQPDSFTALRGKKTQHALSAITELSLTDQLSMTAGLRLTRMKMDDTSYGPYFKPYDNSFNQTSKYLGFNYKLTDQYSLYASYTDIFQPQSVLDASGKYLDPVVGKNYEVGFKAGLFGGNLNFAAAVFEVKRDNVAEMTDKRLPSGDGIYRPINGAKTRGFDIELAGAITDQWNIQAGYTSYVARDAKGQRISRNNPNQMFKLFTTYRLSGALNNMTIGGGVNWVSETAVDIKTPQGKPFEAKQKSYAVVNLMMRYDINKDANISVNINNLFDKNYYTSYGFYSQYQYGAPRNIQASFKYQF